VARCDVLLALGASNRGAIFGLRGGFFQVQVDREPLQLGRRPCRTLGLHGTTRETLRALLPRLRGRLAGQERKQAGRARFLRRHRRQFERWQAQADAAHGRSRRRPIAPPAICHALTRTLAELGRRAVVTVDVGVNTLWVYRHFLGDHDFVWTSSFATMGFAVPAALAIRELEPERTVIAMAGDGGMGLSLGDLMSAAARGLPVVVVVFDNGKLAAIKYEQEVMGWPEFGSALCNGSFAAYAQACGVRGLRVTDPAELAPALREALTCGEPCLVDVVCDPHFMPAPPRIHPRQAAGYLLALSRELGLRLRALLGGRSATASERVPQPQAR
jgi:thiamine pyrophosphate-dependent acetolactate synthase large subunit-like protein